MLGRKKKIVEEPYEVEEVADIEVPLEEEQVQEPEPIQAPIPQVAPSVPVQQPTMQEVKMVKEEPLSIRIVSGQITEDGFLYTVVTNKPFGNIGEVITLR